MANKKGHWTEYLLAGGTAGMVARTCIAPVERMKILFQVQKGTTNTNMRHLLSSLINNEGPLSMWKGNSAAVIRVIPYTALQFTAFEHFSVMLASQQQSPSDIDKTLRAIGHGASTYGVTKRRAGRHALHWSLQCCNEYCTERGSTSVVQRDLPHAGGGRALHWTQIWVLWVLEIVCVYIDGRRIGEGVASMGQGSSGCNGGVRGVDFCVSF
jgi:hypothetical protein